MKEIIRKTEVIVRFKKAIEELQDELSELEKQREGCYPLSVNTLEGLIKLEECQGRILKEIELLRDEISRLEISLARDIKEYKYLTKPC